MHGIRTFFTPTRKQFIILLALSSGFMAFMAILHYSANEVFNRLFGAVNPLVISLITIITGFLALAYLLNRKWFPIYRKVGLGTVQRYIFLLLVFVAVAISVDLAIVFPADMNVLFPESLLFYPAIAFLVELLFHVVPLAVLMIVLYRFFKAGRLLKPVWIAIGIVALLEPSYQVFMDDYPTWATFVVWANLCLFNWVQLAAFKRHGFVFMYSLRLIYYLLWHVIWGEFRLEVLF